MAEVAEAIAVRNAIYSRYLAAHADFDKWMGWRFYLRPIKAGRHTREALREMQQCASDMEQLVEGMEL